MRGSANSFSVVCLNSGAMNSTCVHSIYLGLRSSCLFKRSSGAIQLNTGVVGGAMVLAKLPVPGCPTNLGISRARA